MTAQSPAPTPGDGLRAAIEALAEAWDDPDLERGDPDRADDLRAALAAHPVPPAQGEGDALAEVIAAHRYREGYCACECQMETADLCMRQSEWPTHLAAAIRAAGLAR